MRQACRCARVCRQCNARPRLKRTLEANYRGEVTHTQGPISFPMRSFTTAPVMHTPKSPPSVTPARTWRKEHVSSIAVHDPRPYDYKKHMPKRVLQTRNIRLQPPTTKVSVLLKWQLRTLALINASRFLAGIHQLRLSPSLNAVALRHNADQAFIRMGISHIGSDGARLGQRLKRMGYYYRNAAENVAAGQKSPEHVHRSLMNSPGHRKNILSAKVVEIGIHVGRGADGRLYWTQVFGKIKSRHAKS